MCAPWAVYLKSLPAGPPEPKVTPPSDAEMKAGQAIYARACIACHEADGSSAPRIYPPFRATPCCNPTTPPPTIRIILDGAHERDDAARAQHRLDAGLRKGPVRRADRRRRQLHPQFLGQFRAAGQRWRGEEGAALI